MKSRSLLSILVLGKTLLSASHFAFTPPGTVIETADFKKPEVVQEYEGFFKNPNTSTVCYTSEEASRILSTAQGKSGSELHGVRDLLTGGLQAACVGIKAEWNECLACSHPKYLDIVLLGGKEGADNTLTQALLEACAFNAHNRTAEEVRIPLRVGPDEQFRRCTRGDGSVEFALNVAEASIPWDDMFARMGFVMGNSQMLPFLSFLKDAGVQFSENIQRGYYRRRQRLLIPLSVRNGISSFSKDRHGEERFFGSQITQDEEKRALASAALLHMVEQHPCVHTCAYNGEYYEQLYKQVAAVLGRCSTASLEGPQGLTNEYHAQLSMIHSSHFPRYAEWKEKKLKEATQAKP